MAVRIRLSRIGRKHVPFFRVVAVDGRKKRDGECLDNIGTYDALQTKIIRFDDQLYEKWLKRGAQPSDTVRKLYRLHKKAQPAAAAPAVKEKAPAKAAAPKAKSAAQVEKPAAPKAKVEAAPKAAAKKAPVEKKAVEKKNTEK